MTTATPVAAAAKPGAAEPIHFGITDSPLRLAPERDAADDPGMFYERLAAGGRDLKAEGYCYAAYVFGTEDEGLSVAVVSTGSGTAPFGIRGDAAHAGRARDVWHGISNRLPWHRGSRSAHTYAQAKQDAFDFLYRAHDWIGQPLPARPVLESEFRRWPKAYRSDPKAPPASLFLSWDDGTISTPVQVVLDELPVYDNPADCPRCHSKFPAPRRNVHPVACGGCGFQFVYRLKPIK